MNLLRKVTASTIGVLIQGLKFVIGPLGLLQNWLQLLYMSNRFQSRPDDIYIATAPKAGTTWTQMILYQLMTGAGESSTTSTSALPDSSTSSASSAGGSTWSSCRLRAC